MEKIETRKNKDASKNSKKYIFEKEQFDILDKFNKILGINSDNNIIRKCDITEEIEKQLLELQEEVRKYFAAATWGIFSREPCKNNPILLFKSIYKYFGYTIISKTVTQTKDCKKFLGREYQIIKIT